MTNNMARCLELTLTSCLMCINTIVPVPTWMLVFAFLCVIWVFLPDEIEIWL